MVEWRDSMGVWWRDSMGVWLNGGIVWVYD